ncbi:DNA cytosine methyltransferase [Leucobacter sp. NPDC077196]|uniref:DNA cytosine methyltransferase n=1 Tax=Leucobacter sp. NPDC077196 TaxID=3154959 RepID=UPI0034258A32
MNPVTALDVFAGVGWGVACQWLGVREYGVEIAKSAIRLRAANGMRTIYRDVWSGLFHEHLVPEHDLYIASPPCQTFSMAGKGGGRKALEDVLRAIDEHHHEDAARLHELTESLDPRTALVLTPLAHIYRHRPRLVALEQVPEVLPVWHAYANVMRGLGYSVRVEIMRSEQYGVPQTRKRAILMARLDGKIQPPAATHSRFYPTNPDRLDPGVEKWVTMADALGWGMTNHPYLTIASGRETGGPNKEKVGGSAARAKIYAELDAGRWVFERPATTVVGTFSPHMISAPGHRDFKTVSRQDVDGSVRVSLEQAAALQSFPADFKWRGTKTAKFLAVGNAVPPLMAAAILGALLAPPAERDAWDNVFAAVAG